MALYPEKEEARADTSGDLKEDTMIFRDKEVTIDEAIAIMKQTRVKVASGTVKSYETARDLLIKEAGYRVAKEPLYDTGGHTSYLGGKCPTCHKMVDEIEDNKFCHECGQKLSWE